MKSTTYHGWKNYQTWNVAMWIGNDDGLYMSAVDFMQGYKGGAPYVAFIKRMGLNDQFTHDRVKWTGKRLDYKALNEMMKELGGC